MKNEEIIPLPDAPNYPLQIALNSDI